MKSVHNYITVIFLIGMAVLVLDWFQLYYYFERLIWSFMILCALIVCAYHYQRSTKKWFVSCMLIYSLFATLLALSQHIQAAAIYMQTRTVSLRIVEDIIYQSQSNWMCFHYFIAALLTMFVFFYYVINWRDWLHSKK